MTTINNLLQNEIKRNLKVLYSFRKLKWIEIETVEMPQKIGSWKQLN